MASMFDKWKQWRKDRGHKARIEQKLVRFTINYDDGLSQFVVVAPWSMLKSIILDHAEEVREAFPGFECSVVEVLK